MRQCSIQRATAAVRATKGRNNVPVTGKVFTRLRDRLPRALAAVTAALFLTAALSSCMGLELQYAPSVEPPLPVYPEGTPSPTADPEVIRYSELLGQVLSEIPDKSDALNGAPLDSLFRPVLDSTGQSSYTTARMHFSEPGSSPDTDVTISGEAAWNADTGDASFVAYSQTGSGAPEQVGVWFSGNTMLLKKGHDSLPLLQHTLTPQVSQSMSGLPAFTRLMRVLGDTNEIKLSKENWTSAVGGFLQSVVDNGRALDITSENRNETLGGVKVPTVSETLKLGGERGLTVVRGLIALLAKESAFKTLFNTQYFIDDTEYGVTGFDGALRDIDALAGSDRGAALTTIELIETERPVGFRISVSAGGKTMALNLIFYDRGLVRQDELLFGGFDSSRVFISQLVTTDGSGAFTSNFTYDAMNPGAKPQENISVISSGTETDGALNVTSQFSMTRAASYAAGAVMIGGTLSYAQQTDGVAAQGSGWGTLNINDSGVTHAYNYDISLEQNGQTAAVKPPVFDKSAGRSTVTQDSLYQALGAFDGSSFILAPPTARFQAVITLLFN